MSIIDQLEAQERVEGQSIHTDILKNLIKVRGVNRSFIESITTVVGYRYGYATYDIHYFRYIDPKFLKIMKILNNTTEDDFNNLKFIPNYRDHNSKFDKK